MVEPSTPAPAPVRRGDAGTVAAGGEVLAGQGRRRGLARLWPFLGPAFVAAVAYVDPGNFATNIQGGAQFGYRLVWVVVASNLMAMLIQSLSAKLGIATGRNLAELCREKYPRWLVWLMWVLMELVAMATDLAEFLGAALGFYLLFGIPLWIAGLLTAVVTFLILGLERYGFRPLEAVITALVGVIAGCYLIETFLAPPAWREVAGGLAPRFDPVQTGESVLLATGILGATVMPHVIFLHSSLTQGRIITRDPAQLKKLFRFQLADVGIAMSIAGAINAAMLIMAATTFYYQGRQDVASIETAYQTLDVLLGRAAKYVFGVSLLAAGLSSSAVGTMAGQVIMQGFLNFHIPIWVRRVATMAPALVVIFIGWDATRTLVISQVVLSFGLPFAIIPLVLFTARVKLMGPLVNRKLTTVVAAIVALLIVGLNVFLLYQMLVGG
jgi:manganese transport protein